MKYKLRHQTLYEYDNYVDNYHGIICMQPLSLTNQICSKFEISIEPKPLEIINRIDYFGNIQHFFSIHSPHKSLKVVTSSNVLINPITHQHSTITCKEALGFIEYELELKIDLYQYRLPSYFISWDEDIISFSKSCFEPTNSLYDSVLKLTHKIFSEFEFKSGFSNVNTPLKTILKERKGVCQDFSHLAIACIRSMGFAARYVSGYIETEPPKGKPKLQGTDASHAWISVYIPYMGWCEFDPTNNLVPSDKHIVVAYGRDYNDVAPMKGIIFSTGNHKVKVEVDVIREE